MSSVWLHLAWFLCGDKITYLIWKKQKQPLVDGLTRAAARQGCVCCSSARSQHSARRHYWMWLSNIQTKINLTCGADKVETPYSTTARNCLSLRVLRGFWPPPPSVFNIVWAFKTSRVWTRTIVFLFYRVAFTCNPSPPKQTTCQWPLNTSQGD